MAIKTNMQDLRPRRERFKKDITLLSRGYTNPTAWPGGKLTVFPWDSEVDSWLMASARKGLSENATLFGLVEVLCDLNGAQIDQFVASEVLAVLLVARSIQTDCVLQYVAECPNPVCRHHTDESIIVPDQLGRVGEKKDGYLGYDEITLPDCKDVVRLRPLLVRDELAVEQRTDDERKLVSDEMANLLRSIMAIGGGVPESLPEVLQWYKALSPKDAKFYAEQQDELSPHLDVRVPHRCDKCNREFKHILGLNKEFFR